MLWLTTFTTLLCLTSCGRVGIELLGSSDGLEPDGGVCGECGCGVSLEDGDGDGTPDCADECAADANKARAGRCGCGVSEQDTDLDGTPDCVDRCPGTSAPYTPDGSCGVGYCRTHNVASTCSAGVEVSCMPAAPLAQSDATCDGVDADCDGSVDEDYAAMSTSCGKGACTRGGTRSCVAGIVVDSCMEGAPTADANCNGVDDDCDGTPDDDYVTMSTLCGMGACSASGVLSCVGGAEIDSCTPPSMPATSDTTCNNIDDDCDGTVDEDFVVTSTSCGVGACGATGLRTCRNGMVIDSCVAGTRTTTTDTVCNNIDDDCDGAVDEEFVVTSTNCGVGYCAATGQRTCVAGATRDSCTPRAPRTATDDAFVPGNGVDDNCNGRIDEDVPPCTASTVTYEAGRYTVAVPGNCHSLTVRLWGGGGASGGSAGFLSGGNGGPGGYSTTTSLITGTIDLSVGSGGASGCAAAGTNASSSAYNGGAGGGADGADGADGIVSGGGAGGTPPGNFGGRGYYGGGGGGAGSRSSGLGVIGNGAGGGAASVLVINGARAAVAGGGGGAGGAEALHASSSIGTTGGAGGAGCGGSGATPGGSGGGGGGGGVCIGSTTQRGSGTAPANAGSIPSTRATGGSGNCRAGGNGYGIITFAP